MTNELDEKVNNVAKELKSKLGMMTEKLSKFGEEYRMVSVSKRKKDVVIDKAPCFISQTNDARVIVHFSTTDQADNFYERFTETIKVDGLSWFKKIVYKWLLR